MMRELRYALRRLARQGGATLIAIATLACAIGAAAATWTLVSATILHPIPGASTDGWQVVHVDRDGARTTFEFTYPALRLVEESGAFERSRPAGPLWSAGGFRDAARRATSARRS